MVVRCRPVNEKEKADGRERIVEMDSRQGQVAVSGLVKLYLLQPALALMLVVPAGEESKV